MAWDDDEDDYYDDDDWDDSDMRMDIDQDNPDWSVPEFGSNATPTAMWEFEHETHGMKFGGCEEGACLFSITTGHPLKRLLYYKIYENDDMKEFEEWLINSEQFGEIFLTKNMDEGYESGLWINMDTPVDRAWVGLACFRAMSENPTIFLSYQHFREKGMSIPDAFFFAEKYRLSKGRDEKKYCHWRSPLHGHGMDPLTKYSMFNENKFKPHGHRCGDDWGLPGGWGTSFCFGVGTDFLNTMHYRNEWMDRHKEAGSANYTDFDELVEAVKGDKV